MRIQAFKFSPAAYMRGEASLPTQFALADVQASFNRRSFEKTPCLDPDKWGREWHDYYTMTMAAGMMADMLGLASELWRSPRISDLSTPPDEQPGQPTTEQGFQRDEVVA